MRKKIKPITIKSKFAGAILIVLIAVAPLLVSTFLQGKKLWVSYEMKEALEKSKLHTITTSANTFTWVKENKEILINNELFDVKEWSVENNQYRFTGLFDKEETEIAQLIISIERNKSLGGNKKINSLAFHIPTGCSPTEFQYQISRTSATIKFKQLVSQPIVAHLPIEGPPPRC